MSPSHETGVFSSLFEFSSLTENPSLYPGVNMLKKTPFVYIYLLKSNKILLKNGKKNRNKTSKPGPNQPGANL